MSYWSRSITLLLAIAFGFGQSVPAYSQAKSADSQQSYHIIPEDWVAHFNGLLSLPLTGPESDQVKDALGEILKFEDASRLAHDNKTTPPSSTETLARLPVLKASGDKLDAALRSFNHEIQAGHLKGLVDNKVWGDCGLLPEKLFDSLAALPTVKDGETVPPDKVQAYKTLALGLDSKQVNTCKKKISDIRNQLQKVEDESAAAVQEYQKQIDQLEKKATKTDADKKKIDELRNKQTGEQKKQHQAASAKKGLDGWKTFLGVASIIGGIILCACDDPVDGMQLIAAGAGLLFGDGKSEPDCGDHCDDGPPATDTGQKLANASKGGDATQAEVDNLAAKFKATPVTVAGPPKGSLVLLFDQAGGLLTVADAKNPGASLLSIKLSEIEQSSSWKEQSLPALTTLTSASGWSIDFANRYVDIYFVATFGAQTINLALIEAVDGHFVAIDDTKTTVAAQ